MEDRNLINQVMIIGGIILVLYLIASCYYGKKSVENFSPFESEKELNQYYEGSTTGIKDYLVDTMVCSKQCCGDQWPVPFDGLSSAEVEQSISTLRSPGPFVRTNYTCANGINGVGCPCISKDAYKFIVNKGRNAHDIEEIEPTFLIRGNEPIENDTLSPYESLQAYRSMYVDIPKLNDRELSRQSNPVNDVESSRYKSSSAGY